MSLTRSTGEVEIQASVLYKCSIAELRRKHSESHRTGVIEMPRFRQTFSWLNLATSATRSSKRVLSCARAQQHYAGALGTESHSGGIIERFCDNQSVEMGNQRLLEYTVQSLSTNAGWPFNRYTV